jgi:hypothetical protein
LNLRENALEFLYATSRPYSARQPLYRNAFRTLGLTGGILLTLVALLASLGTARAQQTQEVTDQVEIGPYSITVVGGASQIALGSAQYAVTPRSAADGQPVTNARVVIHTRHQEEGVSGWATALNTPETPDLYRVRLELDRPGTWDVSVEVSSPLGQVEAGITPLVIPEARQYGSGSLVFLGVTAVLLGGLVYVLWSIRRAQRQRSARSGTDSPAGPAEVG